jgi:hypothetical protein
VRPAVAISPSHSRQSGSVRSGGEGRARLAHRKSLGFERWEYLAVGVDNVSAHTCLPTVDVEARTSRHAEAIL